jgi:hypothetical protein
MLLLREELMGLRRDLDFFEPGGGAMKGSSKNKRVSSKVEAKRVNMIQPGAVTFS